MINAPRKGQMLARKVAGSKHAELKCGFQPLYTGYTGGTVTDTVHSAAGKCFYKLDVRLP